MVVYNGVTSTMTVKLIITGPARSGTSFLSKFITEMGYDTGGEWIDKIDGGLEDCVVADINANLLRRFKDKEIQYFTDQDVWDKKIKKLDRIVIKQPRFTASHDILRFWYKAIPGFKVLLTNRNFNHCHMSVLKYQKNVRYTVQELKIRQAEFINTLLELDIDFEMLYFSKFLKEYEKVYKYFQKLGITFDENKGYKIWNNLVDFNKVHFK